MTIAILRQDHDQNVPRPWNRASDVNEMIGMLEDFCLREAGFSPIYTKQMEETARLNLGTEEPVMHLECSHSGSKFYAFHEAV